MDPAPARDAGFSRSGARAFSRRLDERNHAVLLPGRRFVEIGGKLASAGVDEGAEDATLVAIGSVGELRMPLDGPDETFGRHPDRLHDAVRRGGHRFQSLAQRANRLMVIAVDAQRIGARMIRPAEGIDLIGLRLTRAVVSQRPQRTGQRRIGRDRHFVGHRVIRRLVAMMRDRAGMFVRQILPQRATQGDVEALDAAADAPAMACPPR